MLAGLGIPGTETSVANLMTLPLNLSTFQNRLGTYLAPFLGLLETLETNVQEQVSSARISLS